MIELREKNGEIILNRQESRISLTKAKVIYVADFEVQDLTTGTPGSLKYIEMKGFETAEWKLKKRLYRHYAIWPLEIWMRDKRTKRIYLAETIHPQIEQQ